MPRFLNKTALLRIFKVNTSLACLMQYTSRITLGIVNSSGADFFKL